MATQTKSFAESLELQKVDWEALVKAFIKKEPTDEIHADWNKLAETWKTCPVGQLNHLLPRDKHDKFRPIDDLLNSLGCKFSDAFETKSFVAALNYVQLIQVRGKYLLMVHLAKLKLEVAEKQAQVKELNQLV